MMEMLASSWLRGVVTIVFAVICLFLIVIILLQKGRGGGLAGAFGGAGGHSAFGAKTGDVFTWITVGLTFLFFVMAVVGNYVFVPDPLTTPAPPVIEQQATEDNASPSGESAQPDSAGGTSSQPS